MSFESLLSLFAINTPGVIFHFWTLKTNRTWRTIKRQLEWLKVCGKIQFWYKITKIHAEFTLNVNAKISSTFAAAILLRKSNSSKKKHITLLHRTLWISYSVFTKGDANNKLCTYLNFRAKNNLYLQWNSILFALNRITRMYLQRWERRAFSMHQLKLRRPMAKQNAVRKLLRKMSKMRHFDWFSNTVTTI